MKPPVVDPVCGMAYEEGFKKITYRGKQYVFCAEGCAEMFLREPEKYGKSPGVRGKYHLAFYDTKTSRLVLDVPIVFQGKGEMKNAGHHEH
ncbi:MAG: YHS domain-containing protein [Deltaproteobacteria bacterium]